MSTSVSRSRHKSFIAHLPARAAVLSKPPNVGPEKALPRWRVFGHLEWWLAPTPCHPLSAKASGVASYVPVGRETEEVTDLWPLFFPVQLLVMALTNWKILFSLPPNDVTRILRPWIFTAHLSCYGWGFSQFCLRRYLATRKTRIREI